jgi:hypothetical protein
MLNLKYKNKYLKYKNKYLQLKITMKGGGIPYLHLHEQLNLFTDPDMEKFMNPIKGLILYHTGFLSNIYWLGKYGFLQQPFMDVDKQITNMGKNIIKVITYIPNIIKPRNKYDKILPIQFGRFIALKYINMKNNNKFIIYSENKKFISNIQIPLINETLNLFDYFLFINNDFYIFSLILFCLCWNINNDDGIHKYYEGIKEIFELLSCEQQIIIQQEQVKKQKKQKRRQEIKKQQAQQAQQAQQEQQEPQQEQQEPQQEQQEPQQEQQKPLNLLQLQIPELILEPKENLFEKTILYITQQQFIVLHQRQARHFCGDEIKPETYPDCVEITALNLINLLIYDGSKLDIQKLPHTTIDQVKEFYKQFNDLDTINDENLNKTIFGQELNARDAWSYIIIHYANNNLNFKYNCVHAYELTCELNKTGDKSNFHQLLMNLLGINDLQELKNDIILEITDNSINGEGTIEISHKIYDKVEIICGIGHYFMAKISVVNKKILQKYKKNKIIKIILNKIPLSLENPININISSELLEKKFNNIETEIELKKILFLLSLTDKFDNDLRRRMIIDINKKELFCFIQLILSNFNLFEKFNYYTYKYIDFSFVKSLRLINLNTIYENYSLKNLDLSTLANLTSIGDSFLAKCTNLKSLDLSTLSNLTSIGKSFLVYCYNLTSLELSPLSKLTSISNSFLYGCTNLANLNLCPLINITSIGFRFLFNCANLTTLDLSPLTKLTSIGDEFLAYCYNLTRLELPQLLNLTSNSFLKKCTSLTNLNLYPLANITSIPFEFLNDCYNLTSLDLSPLSKLTSISSSFLFNCTNLTSVDLSSLSEFTSISDSFLRGCYNLASLDLSPLSKVTSIGDRFLGGCYNLASLDLSPLSKLTSIGDSFLYGCYNLTSLDLSPLSKLTSISNYYFLNDCTNLTNLVLCHLTNLTSIDNNFLINCFNLRNLDLSGLINITSIGNYFLNNCTNLTSLVLSPLINLTSIGNNFLKNCFNLRNLDLSGLIKLTYIDNYFLYGCTNLTSLDLSHLKNLDHIGYNFLYGCTNLTQLSYLQHKHENIIKEKYKGAPLLSKISNSIA